MPTTELEVHAPELTDEQRVVVGAPPAERQIVLAQAGSGKTHVLIKRVEYLIEGEDLAGGDELILLTFSRAVVRELRNRASSSGGEARFATISTFDSFATKLLADELPEGRYAHLGYDDRIRLATETLGSTSARCDVVSMCKHILIDEIQDVVGVRAEMVLALLLRTDCGFTLLGDLAQSIYGFQSEEMSPEEMLEGVRSTFASDVCTRTLTTSFRAKSQHAKEVLKFGGRFLDPSEDPSVLSDDLRTFQLTLPGFGSLSEMKRLLKPGCPSIAVLTRTNGTALLASDQLHQLGVSHQIQPRSELRPAAAWVARAFAGLDNSTVTRTRAIDMLDGVLDVGEVEGVAQRLVSLSHSKGEIDLRRIAEMIRRGAVPEDLEPGRDAEVIISTIHRAKGLEFERVAVVDDFNSRDGEVGEESRILYVALTRARDDIFVLDKLHPADGQLARKAGRWCIERFRSKGRYTSHIELEGPDASAERLEGLSSDPAGAVRTQAYLASSVRQGDLVLLEKFRGDEPLFWILHEGTRIGRTSERFEQAMIKVLGPRAYGVSRIEGVRVEMVDTVAGDPAMSRHAGMGSNGLWLRARVCGLGQLVFGGAEPHA